MHWRLKKELEVRAAVLLQAIADLDYPLSISLPARRWIAGEVPSPAGYSFDDIADLFGFDGTAARFRLLTGHAMVRGPHYPGDHGRRSRWHALADGPTQNSPNVERHDVLE